MHHFRADCSRCCGLCCIAPAFFQIQGFGSDKPAGTRCPHLERTGACAVHAERAAVGYTACAGFDCYGAGQWVTQALFAGAHWSESGPMAAQMLAAYRDWLPRFEAAALLEVALGQVNDAARAGLQAEIARLMHTAASPGESLDPVRLKRETLAMIRRAIKHSPRP